jgi:hypothetical protein
VKYTVYWSKAASDSLAEIWLALDSAKRSQLNQLISDIEELLRFEPEQQGESRDENRRIIFAAPLIITYRAVPERQTVQILFVRLIKAGG